LGGVISYLYSGQHYVYAFSPIGDMGSVIVASDMTLRSGESASEMAVKLEVNSGRVVLNSLLAFYDPSSPSGSEFGLAHFKHEFNQKTLEMSSLELERGGTQYERLSLGFDFLGRGLAGWIKGAGSERLFFTSRFGGVTWNTAIPVSKLGYGIISDGEVFVFEDGQSIYAWIEAAGGTSKVIVQGLFPDDGVSRFVRPSALQLYSAPEVGGILVVGDREGNALVSFHAGGRNYAVRFRQNVAWESAWNDADDVGVYSGIRPVLRQIRRDGRMALLNKRSLMSYDEVSLRMFSDFD
jgi:hypothetical protein